MALAGSLMGCSFSLKKDADGSNKKTETTVAEETGKTDETAGMDTGSDTEISVSEPVSIPAVSSVFPVSSATVVSVFLLLPSASFFKEKLHPMRLPASAILNTINPAFFSSFLPSFLYLITASLYFQHFLLPAVWF